MEYRDFLLLLAISLAVFSLKAAAETTGGLNTTAPSAAAPPTSGLYGYSVNFCDGDGECADYKCFRDYDGTSSGSKAGWCNLTSITDCFHDGVNYTKGFYFCTTNTTYRRCDAGGNGTWSGSTECSSGQTCSSGTTGCSAASSSSISSGGSGAGDTTKKAAVEITVKFGDFEMVQGGNTTRNVTVKSTGDLNLGNVYVEISGVPFASVLTGGANINKSKSRNFTISFQPASAADVRTYDGELKVITNYTNATASFSFKIKLLPSNATVEESIIPSYGRYLALIEEYEKNMTELEKQGYNVTDAKSILVTMKGKMQELNQSIASRDYFKAASQISEMKVLFDEMGSALLKAERPKEADYLLYLVIAAAVIVLVAGVMISRRPKTESMPR